MSSRDDASSRQAGRFFRKDLQLRDVGAPAPEGFFSQNVSSSSSTHPVIVVGGKVWTSAVDVDSAATSGDGEGAAAIDSTADDAGAGSSEGDSIAFTDSTGGAIFFDASTMGVLAAADARRGVVATAFLVSGSAVIVPTSPNALTSYGMSSRAISAERDGLSAAIWAAAVMTTQIRD